MPEIHIRTIGLISICLAILHFAFPSRFNWKQELKSLSLINKQLMQVHTFFIALVVLLMGLLCLFMSSELVHTLLGKWILRGMFVFWFTRLIFQFFVYSSRLWKGKKFETIIHIIFSFTWIYFSAVMLLASI